MTSERPWSRPRLTAPVQNDQVPEARRALRGILGNSSGIGARRLILEWSWLRPGSMSATFS
jgi:hypothetical protein